MNARLAACLLAAAISSVGVASAAPAPRVTSIGSLGELQTPLPYPYDETGNADAHVDAALADAKRQHKLAFIDLGGNWCGDCRVLAGLMELPEYKRFIDAHYVVVTVDVGRFNKNLQIPARWGITDRLEGVPAVLIVDPVTNRLIDAGHVSALADARHMDPQSILDWIAEWTR
ncbi:MAG TPA: thioredoxin family protein [Rhizomicrobium sp.]|jgi:thiol-disulfide isomerase/thioredoxin